MFEKSDSIGGTWIYLEPPTNGKINQKSVNRKWDVHSSMYDVLLTNVPKEIMGFEELPFDGIVPKDGESFISRQHVLTYLEEYAKPVKHLIQFNTVVLNVEPVEQSNSEKRTQWKVTVSQKIGKTGESKTITGVFDVVFVCNGHFSCPRLPPFLSKYKLPSFHSHYYRKADIYSGQTVCVIGAGFSGMDICLQVAEFAKTVYLSHRNPSSENTTFGSLPNNCIEIGLVTDATANSLILTNGEELKDIDAVISCTGYKYSYPFFKDSGVIETPADGSYVSPCLHIVRIHQVLFAAALMLNLVPQEELDKDMINEYEEKRIKQLEASGKLLRHYHQLGPEQWSYYDYVYKLKVMKRKTNDKTSWWYYFELVDNKTKAKYKAYRKLLVRDEHACIIALNITSRKHPTPSRRGKESKTG
uniref:Flavin-containing monooxygenase n=1 Tax=Ditylenchus dipsaci TaxID=166011 RepID=A0A915DA94_9BILA